MYSPQTFPDVVFADPQVLLDKVSELVFKSVKPSKKVSSGEWKKFCEEALVEICFQRVQESLYYVPGLFEVDHLVELFLKLLIFATFSESEYFVPALLVHLDRKALDDHRVKSIPSLVLQFPEDYPGRASSVVS